jgi:hypothetical protein
MRDIDYKLADYRVQHVEIIRYHKGDQNRKDVGGG